MNISNIVWKRNHCTHNEFVQLKLAFLSYPRYREEMDGGKEGREPEETYREVSITIQPSFIIFPGARIRVLCARQNIATRLKSPFLRAQCVTRTAMLKSACCKRTTRIEIDAYGEPRAARGLVDTIRSGTTTTDSRPGKFDPFAPSTIEK